MSEKQMELRILFNVCDVDRETEREKEGERERIYYLLCCNIFKEKQEMPVRECTLT